MAQLDPNTPENKAWQKGYKKGRNDILNTVAQTFRAEVNRLENVPDSNQKQQELSDFIQSFANTMKTSYPFWDFDDEKFFIACGII